MTWRSGLLLVLLLVPTQLLSEGGEAASIELSIACLEREGIRARGIRVQLLAGDDSMSLQADIREISLPGQPVPLRSVKLICPVAHLEWPAIACDQAVLEVADSPWGAQRIEAALDWRSAEDWQLKFAGLRYAGDSLSGKLDMGSGGWQLKANAKALRLARLQPLKPLRGDAGLESLSGTLAARVELHGNDAGVQRVVLNGGLRNLNWADAEGLQAAEKLRARYKLTAQRVGKDWRGNAQLRLLAGQVYSDPVFLDFKAQPVRLDLQGRWKKGLEQLDLKSLKLDAGSMLQISGRAQVATAKGRMQEARLSIGMADLAAAYSNLLQPLLIDSAFDDLQVEGDAHADLVWREGALQQVDLQVGQLDMDHSEGTFGAYELAAQVHWRAEGDAPPSQLGFSAAHLGKLDVGGALARFSTSGSYLYLLEPVSLPFYRGSIDISDLTWLTTDQGHEAGFSLGLHEVALEGLSQALGWPGMSGSIEGQLPRARLTQDTLEVAGDIVIEAFDGQMLLRGLRLDQLGSVAPVLEAELELQRLDLAKLTETFSFGMIRGRLEGEVRNLQLVAWEPNRFEAHFRSPQDDDLPHRISQGAIEDLTKLGNGVSGALSGTFLRFFKEFSYDRVELKVTQRGDRAEIDGMPYSGGGYYLVKGAGIPRIDVIGRNREVAWSDLVDRLKSIRFDEVEIE